MAFFECYLNGQEFSASELRKMGYNKWPADNLSAYIDHEHDDYYGHALTWEY
jgi:hypothetical protein